MAEASKTVEMKAKPEELWKVITDYESYPKFLDTVHQAKVLSRDGNTVRVQYSIELLGKEVTYILDHKEKANEKMDWTLVESNILKANTGGWVIHPLSSGKIEVTYNLSLEFKIFVPNIVLGGLVKSTLPSMLSQFEKQIHAA
ncbi:MAG: type II toxin-antitoxin system RatA family toxin [Bacteriovoracia bacterium]